MPIITGILVDVSGSMKSCVDKSYNPKGESWSRSIIKVVDELIKEDVSEDNVVFAAGFGASQEPVTFDLLRTVEKGLEVKQQYLRKNEKKLKRYEHYLRYRNTDKSQILEQILCLLETNGAPYICDWAKVEDLDDSIGDEQAQSLLVLLEDNSVFRHRFVKKCLPNQCRVWSAGSEAVRWGARIAGSIISVVKDSWDGATKEKISRTVRKGINLAEDMGLVPDPVESMEPIDLAEFGNNSVMGVKQANSILHECTDDKEMSEAQREKLMETVDPYIYGGTPMKEAVEQAERLFARSEYSNHKKLLFILSDGEPNDTNFKVTGEDIYVTCCFITNENIRNSKQLFSTDCNEFVGGAEFMFNLSSHVATEKIPRLPPDWTVDWTTNQTKLFFQINNPDLIKDVCTFAKDVVCTKNALSDIAGSISLDLYINQCREYFKAQNQKGMTCYANAIATVIHLATKRIVGREDGYPDFDDIRGKMIEKYGKDGADTRKFLKEVCPKYRLRCAQVDLNGAAKQITDKCPVVARFDFTGCEWDAFWEFFKKSKEGVLSVRDLGNRRLNLGGFRECGHSVVLTTFNSDDFKFMNSWGSGFADKGFFRVKKEVAARWEFFAVYWEESDLTDVEKDTFQKTGAERARQAMEQLKAFRNHQYECPLCNISSCVREFEGVSECVKCPRCGKTFDSKGREDIALTMHLNSLWVK